MIHRVHHRQRHVGGHICNERGWIWIELLGTGADEGLVAHYFQTCRRVEDRWLSCRLGRQELLLWREGFGGLEVERCQIGHLDPTMRMMSCTSIGRIDEMILSLPLDLELDCCDSGKT